MSIRDFLERHNNSLRGWWLLLKMGLLALFPSSLEAWAVDSFDVNGDAQFLGRTVVFMVINMIVIWVGYAIVAAHFEQDKEEEERKRRSKMQ